MAKIEFSSSLKRSLWDILTEVVVGIKDIEDADEQRKECQRILREKRNEILFMFIMKKF